MPRAGFARARRPNRMEFSGQKEIPDSAKFRANVFTGSLAVFRFAAKPLIFAGGFLAAAGGEMRSNYFKNGAPRQNFSAFCPIRLAAPLKTAKEPVKNIGSNHIL